MDLIDEKKRLSRHKTQQFSVQRYLAPVASLVFVESGVAPSYYPVHNKCAREDIKPILCNFLWQIFCHTFEQRTNMIDLERGQGPCNLSVGMGVVGPPFLHGVLRLPWQLFFWASEPRSSFTDERAALVVLLDGS